MTIVQLFVLGKTRRLGMYDVYLPDDLKTKIGSVGRAGSNRWIILGQRGTYLTRKSAAANLAIQTREGRSV